MRGYDYCQATETVKSIPLYALIMTLLAAAAGCSGTGQLEDTPPAPGTGFEVTDLDPSVRPQDDFYAHVNGRWIESTEIPPEWSRYGTMQIVYERTEEQLKAIVQSAAADPSGDDNTVKIGRLYNSFMDTEAIEAAGLSPLSAELSQIDALESHANVMAFFGTALLSGINVPIDFYIDADATDPDRALAYLWQDGLGLPDRDYYLSDTPEMETIREKYLVHIDNMLQLAGWADDIDAQTIIAIEQQLAEQHWSRVQNRDRERIYSNQFSLPDAESLSPDLDWRGFLAAGGFGAPETLVIAQTDYFAALGEIVRSIPVADWQSYLRFNALRAYAPYLTDAIVMENFDFRQRILRGQESIRPRWKRAVRLANAALGEAVGQMYVERHFPPEAKQRVDTMIENLRAAFATSIDSLEWMSADTKVAARQKLASFNAKIGYPDEWQDYSALQIEPDDLVGNVRRVRTFRT